ncbi:iron uptake system protein EfeO [Paenibacillus tyrfis]|uniref:Iron ABC transporter substrate-binding protein n=1 Tax=Paenibacillus tyrfis TaxID=1501230 RepID=A0A081P442_9BACL|nr:iron uptake system protein EfeO [Paenibacillus tyrfis]KEQ25465.1 iron ABC transporter substrate-binding protein [Paenibacillus tyrfis]
MSKTFTAVSSIVLCSALLLAGCGENTKKAAQPASAPSASDTAAKPAAAAVDLKNATEQYRKFVIEQCDAFVKATGEFTAAVKSGDLKKSQELYAPTRMFYERIEPIAESLGDLDPNIDAREGDVDEKEWRGFHRIEKTLWTEQTTKGMEETADRLLSDSKLLRAKVETVDIEENMLVTGAVELLNEVSSRKVTGEEERYSHTDLYDFAANVEGANKIFELLKPELEKKDAALAKTIGTRFVELNQALAPFKKGSGYVSYTELTQEQTKKLSQAIDALAEPLSGMGKLLGA